MSLMTQSGSRGVAGLEPYLGPDRYRYLYPAGSLLKVGAMQRLGRLHVQSVLRLSDRRYATWR